MIGGLEIVVGQAVELVLEANARILHGLLRTLTAHHAGVARGRAAQHGDFAVALLDEVGHSLIGGCPVIHANHGQVGKVQLVRHEGGQHRRNADVGKSFLEVCDAAAQENHAFGFDLAQDLFGGVDLVGILVQIRDDAVVPVKGGGPLQLHKKVGEEDIAGAFDHEHQAARLLDLELPCVGVGHKACFPHYLQDSFLGLRPDIRAIVDHTGDRADGTAADPCDIFDRHVAHCRNPSSLKELSETLSGTFPVAIVWHIPYKKSRMKKQFRAICTCSRPVFVQIDLPAEQNAQDFPQIPGNGQKLPAKPYRFVTFCTAASAF